MSEQKEPSIGWFHSNCHFMECSPANPCIEIDQPKGNSWLLLQDFEKGGEPSKGALFSQEALSLTERQSHAWVIFQAHATVETTKVFCNSKALFYFKPKFQPFVILK